MEHEVGAGALAEEAGVAIRTIQFWTDAGVLEAIPKSDRQGRGRHRAYKAAPPLYGESMRPDCRRNAPITAPRGGYERNYVFVAVEERWQTGARLCNGRRSKRRTHVDSYLSRRT